MKSIFKILGILVTSCSLLYSCSDWTEIEAFTVEETNIKEQNPELYVKYLENLREYRKVDHQLVYAWFDNSVKQTYSRVHHLSDIPDSIDVVALMYPDKLVKFEANEIEYIRREKGMKVIYSVDYDKIKQAYNDMVENSSEESVIPGFRQFLTDSLSYSLSLANKYKYDGISVNYVGKSPVYMTDAEKKEYRENETCFMSIVNDWSERNPDMSMVFVGKPENIIENYYILDKCSTIFLKTEEAASANELSFIIADSYLPNYSLKYGAMGRIDNKNLKLQDFSQWANTYYSESGIKAIGIYNISPDYHTTGRSYNNVREAISILNPSIK